MKLETKGKLMKNSSHHLKHLVNKNVRKNSHITPLKQNFQDGLIPRLKIYNETWGYLAIKPKEYVKKTFQTYIHHLMNHPSSVSPRHSRRASPGSVDSDQPHCFMHSPQKEINEHLQQKLHESNLKLSKKLIKESKVRWKKID
jgi:hypothetical protein